MAKLLALDSSPLSSSVSRELTREFVSNWQQAHPSGEVIYRDLAANPPKSVDQTWIFAAFTPAETLQPEQKAALTFSNECIDELRQADEYVFGSPCITSASHRFSNCGSTR
jgi:FMN-dependent NADH-azoreductase